LREEHRLKASEDRLLRRIFGPNRYEIIGDWRQLHNVEIHNLSSLNKIRMIKTRRIKWVDMQHAWERSAYRI
jgi:hypothetical protein